MDIAKYLQSIIPAFSRDQVQEDLEDIAKEIDTHVLPIYVTANNELGSGKLLSANASSFEDIFEKNVSFKYKGNHISAIYESMKNAKELTKLLQRLVDENFAIDITKAGFDLLRTNIMQLTEILSFTVRYARRHLNYIVLSEMGQYKDLKIEDYFTAGERDWIKNGRMAFIKGIDIIHKPAGEIETKLKTIPSVLVTPETVDTTHGVFGKDKTDPLDLRFIPIVLNPIYHIRIRIAEWQAAKYQEAKEERSMVELRLLSLKELKSGKDNARLEQQIEYNQERLSKLTAKIGRMEENYA